MIHKVNFEYLVIEERFLLAQNIPVKVHTVLYCTYMYGVRKNDDVTVSQGNFYAEFGGGYFILSEQGSQPGVEGGEGGGNGP